MAQFFVIRDMQQQHKTVEEKPNFMMENPRVFQNSSSFNLCVLPQSIYQPEPPCTYLTGSRLNNARKDAQRKVRCYMSKNQVDFYSKQEISRSEREDLSSKTQAMFIERKLKVLYSCAHPVANTHQQLFFSVPFSIAFSSEKTG